MHEKSNLYSNGSLVGIFVIGWMAYKDFDLLDFSAINIGWRFYVGLFLAILFFVGRISV